MRSSLLSAFGRDPYMFGDRKLAAMLGRPICSQCKRSSCKNKALCVIWVLHFQLNSLILDQLNSSLQVMHCQLCIKCIPLTRIWQVCAHGHSASCCWAQSQPVVNRQNKQCQQYLRYYYIHKDPTRDQKWLSVLIISGYLQSASFCISPGPRTQANKGQSPNTAPSRETALYNVKHVLKNTDTRSCALDFTGRNKQGGTTLDVPFQRIGLQEY